MTRQLTFYALWLLVVVGSMVTGWVALHIDKVTPNPFNAYERYMPGATISDLRMSGFCENRNDEGRYAMDGYLWCELNDGLVRSIAITSVKEDQVQGVYFFLAKCAVNAGELTLWYDADIKAFRHGTRVVSWAEGRSSVWYPKTLFWSPEKCLYGIWFHDGEL